MQKVVVGGLDVGGGWWGGRVGRHGGGRCLLVGRQESYWIDSDDMERRRVIAFRYTLAERTAAMEREEAFDTVVVPMEEVKLVLTACSQIYDALYFSHSFGYRCPKKPVE